MKKWMLNSLRMSVALIGIIILAFLLFWLPNIAKRFAVSDAEYAYLRYPMLIGLYATAIPFYLGIFHTLKLIKLIESDGAFTEDACRSLGYISIYSMTVIVLYIIGMVFLNVNNAAQPGIFLLGILIIFVAFIISIFAAILKALLTKVVEIKDENDFTI